MSIDWQRVAQWMDTQGLPGGDIEAVRALTGGTQNLMYGFTRGGRGFVLRRPPLHKRAKSDDTMRREMRVLGAIRNEPVPHPRLIAACPDAEVIGAAFYLMEPVEGFNVTNGMPDLHRSSPAARHAMGLSMVDALATVGAVDVLAAGLDDFGNPDGFLQRQPQRWLDELQSYLRLDGYNEIQLPDVQPLADWLTEHLPARWTPGLMHGDFHLGNMLFSRERPELVAICDWEMCTIGDPLLDLGWMLVTWPEGGDTALMPIKPADGFPARAELIKRYAQQSTRSLDNILWYQVLAGYKLAIILENTHARACAGKAPKAVGDFLHSCALKLVERALADIESR
jgi:aminoglycoside phosphotransferase (APT) family kinase protein